MPHRGKAAKRRIVRSRNPLEREAEERVSQNSETRRSSQGGMQVGAGAGCGDVPQNICEPGGDTSATVSL